MAAITFHNEETDFVLEGKTMLRNWIVSVAKKHGVSTGNISYVFCSDAFLLEMNKKFLQHDDLTDIITFDYSIGKAISGDIFISVERVAENAVIHRSGFDEELRRVMIHGVLHLIGFKDKSAVAKKEMRSQEEIALKMWNHE